MQDSQIIEWLDLSGHGSSVFFGRFSEAPEMSFVVVQADGKYETGAALKQKGFLRFGNYFFRPGQAFSLAELKDIFPGAGTQGTPPEETRFLINDEMPEVLQRMGEKRPAPQVTSGDVVFETLNPHQVKYQPLSSGGEPIAAIPVTFAPRTMKALSRLQDKYGVLAWCSSALCGRLALNAPCRTWQRRDTFRRDLLVTVLAVDRIFGVSGLPANVLRCSLDGSFDVRLLAGNSVICVVHGLIPKNSDRYLARAV